MNNHSITTARSTHKHPTLPSQTNYAYPFSKTPRFPPPNPPCPEAFYSYESQLSHRKAGMGYGKKTDFQKLLPNNPPCNNYQIKSAFEVQPTKGSSFGSSREKSPNRSYLIPQIHGHPGPGNYQNQIRTRMSQQYSLRSKTIDVLDKSKTPNFTPGPGTYESVDFEANGGRTRVSKYSDSKFGMIGHLQRFPNIKPSPGPASYQNEDGTVSSGKYTLSRHNGGGGRVFSREARFTGQLWRPSKNPGPGNYEIPSQFGQPENDFHQFYH